LCSFICFVCVRNCRIGARLCTKHQPQQVRKLNRVASFPRVTCFVVAAAGLAATAALRDRKVSWAGLPKLAFQPRRHLRRPKPAVFAQTFAAEMYTFSIFLPQVTSERVRVWA